MTFDEWAKDLHFDRLERIAAKTAWEAAQQQYVGGCETVDLKRVKAWAYSKPRKSAVHAFTAGAERQVAYMIEDAEQRGISVEPSK